MDREVQTAPLTAEDYQYIIEGLSKMIDRLFAVHGMLRAETFKYRIFDRFVCLVAHREWKTRDEIDLAMALFEKDCSTYLRYDQEHQRLIKDRAYYEDLIRRKVEYENG